MIPIALFLVAGFLLGGVITLIRQGATKVSIGVVAALAALAAAGGLVWLLPGDG